MGFDRLKSLVDAEVSLGQYSIASYRKVPTQATLQGVWTDLTMAGGNPVPNFYASEPLVAAVLDGKKGMYTGPSVAPATKHLAEVQVFTSNSNIVPCVFTLCDFLVYYPFIDMDATDEQVFDNTTTLPRYASGDGVQMVLIAQGAPIGGGSFTVNYTNQAGTALRSSGLIPCNTSTNVASSVCGGVTAGSSGPWIRLQAGDTGVRSVESITFTTPNGGIAALVLVKPLATFVIRELNSVVERSFMTELPSIPRIYDGAFIGMLCMPNGSIAASPVTGLIKTVWN